MTKIVGKQTRKPQRLYTSNKKKKFGHLVVIMGHMKGLGRRLRETVETKYHIRVCPSVIIIIIIINQLLYNSNRERNERQSKMGACVCKSWKIEQCDLYDFNNY